MTRSPAWDAMREAREAADNDAADSADDAVCPICKEFLRTPVWHCVAAHKHAQVRAGLEPEPRIEAAAFPDGIDRM